MANFERIILQADFKELDELIMLDEIQVHSHEVINVVLLTVHFKHKDDLFWCDQESFSVVLGHSLLNLIVDKYLLKKGLIVLSVTVALQDFLFHFENLHWYFGGEFLEGLLN